MKKKSKIFTKEEVFAYLRTAPITPQHERARVTLLAGYYGALRCDDLTKLTWENVKIDDEVGVWIELFDRKTGKVQDGHQFLSQACAADSQICAVSIFKRYRLSLERDIENPVAGRLITNIRANKFTTFALGKTFLRQIPKFIADFLGLPDPHLYTGQCFRRTSATSLVDAGCSRQNLKRHGGWASDSVAEGYLSNSKRMRMEVAEMLSEDTPVPVSTEPVLKENQAPAQAPGASFIFNFNNCGTVNLTVPSEKPQQSMPFQESLFQDNSKLGIDFTTPMPNFSQLSDLNIDFSKPIPRLSQLPFER